MLWRTYVLTPERRLRFHFGDGAVDQAVVGLLIEAVAEDLLTTESQVPDLLAERLRGLADLGVDVGTGPGLMRWSLRRLAAPLGAHLLRQAISLVHDRSGLGPEPR